MNEESIKIGDYRVIKKLGEGNMGVVYLAVKESEDMPYAIKVSYGACGSPVRQALKQEAEVLKSLKDSRFPAFYGYEETKELAYLVMEYIPGENLLAVIAKKGETICSMRFLQELVDLLWQLHSHRPPIVYRDLKPANLIVEPSGKLRMIDFGTAIFQGAAGTDANAERVAGTYGYAAPEQRLGKQADLRSDIYAIGAIISYLYTGTSPELPPFEIDTNLSNKNLKEIVRRCIQENPDERFQNAGDLLMDIMKVKDTEDKKKGLFTRGERNGEKINRYIKKREWNIMRSEKQFLGLW